MDTVCIGPKLLFACFAKAIKIIWSVLQVYTLEVHRRAVVNNTVCLLMPQCGHTISDKRPENSVSLLIRHPVKPQHAPLNVQRSM